MPEKNGSGMRDRAVTVTVTMPGPSSTPTVAPAGDWRRATLLGACDGLAPGDHARRLTGRVRDADLGQPQRDDPEQQEARTPPPNGAIVASSAVTMPRSRLIRT